MDPVFRIRICKGVYSMCKHMCMCLPDGCSLHSETALVHRVSVIYVNFQNSSALAVFCNASVNVKSSLFV